MNEFRTVIQFLVHCQPETEGICPGKYKFHPHCGKHIGKEGSRINKVFHERYLIQKHIFVSGIKQLSHITVYHCHRVTAADFDIGRF